MKLTVGGLGSKGRYNVYWSLITFRVFHGFGQAKFPDDGFGFKLEPILNTAPAASKNTAWFKSGQNRPKNNHLASLI